MDLEERVEKLTKEVMAFRKEMLIIKALVKQQNGMIKDLIEVNHQALQSIKNKQYSHNPTGVVFPLTTQGDLDEFESSIDDSNRDQIIEEVTRIIGNSTLTKHLDKIISQHLILEYNIDGHQNKKRLLDYPNFIDILFTFHYLIEATMKDGWTHDAFREELRKGLRLCKNRYFGLLCSQKRRQQMNSTNADTNSSTESGDPYHISKKDK